MQFHSTQTQVRKKLPWRLLPEQFSDVVVMSLVAGCGIYSYAFAPFSIRILLLAIAAGVCSGIVYKRNSFWSGAFSGLFLFLGLGLSTKGFIELMESKAIMLMHLQYFSTAFMSAWLTIRIWPEPRRRLS